jgi:diaphanous 1
MEYTLGIGNYLNGQSARGGAYAYKFDTLEKISDVKSTDNKKNLLMYIIERVEKDFKDI